jgi:hypothetical protein
MKKNYTYLTYRSWQKPAGNHIAPFFGGQVVIDPCGGPSM